MLIDIDNLEDKVKPQIKNTRKYLELGENAIDSINIPSDFSYSTRLRIIHQSILDIDGRVNVIEKWIDTTINDFSSAEIKNKDLIESLISAIPSSLMGGKAVATDGFEASILNSSDFINDIKSSAKGVFDYVISGEWVINPVDMGKKTNSKIGDKIESPFSWAWNTGAEIKEKVTNYFSSEIGSRFEFDGLKISDAWNSVYQNIISPAWDVFKTTGASIANAFIGLINGLGQVIESLLDAIVILTTGVKSIFTVAADGITYLAAVYNGETDEWSSITGSMWKDVMGYVAEDHVGNAFKSSYSNSVIGQWLDENAINILKSDGTGYKIMTRNWKYYWNCWCFLCYTFARLFGIRNGRIW